MRRAVGRAVCGGIKPCYKSGITRHIYRAVVHGDVQMAINLGVDSTAISTLVNPTPSQSTHLYTSSTCWTHRSAILICYHHIYASLNLVPVFKEIYYLY